MNYLTLILMVLNIIGMIYLSRYAFKTQLKNIYWIAIFFFLNALIEFIEINKDVNLIVIPESALFFALGQSAFSFLVLSLTGFTYYTFVNNKSVIGKIMVIIGIIFTVISLSLVFIPSIIYIIAPNNFQTMGLSIISGWFTIEAIISLKRLQKNPYVATWIKIRYLLLIITGVLRTIIWIVSTIVSLFFSYLFPTVEFKTFLNIFGPLMVIFMFSAWIMPKNLKKWLSRNDKENEQINRIELLSENQIKDLINKESN